MILVVAATSLSRWTWALLKPIGYGNETVYEANLMNAGAPLATEFLAGTV
jgi:hypothetical protein